MWRITGSREKMRKRQGERERKRRQGKEKIEGEYQQRTYWQIMEMKRL